MFEDIPLQVNVNMSPVGRGLMTHGHNMNNFERERLDDVICQI